MNAVSSPGFVRSVIFARREQDQEAAPTNGQLFRKFDTVTMTSVTGSSGWVVELRPDRFGVPSALVGWDHHGAKTLIPLHKLELVDSDESEA